ncbi:MICOS complex subunit MIC60, mitochondrial [Cornus florida]|uniref:MICOS complex subunit MIC60, mitochondrial n=1 Tax=Cornus florida TaxID=4283 RepID=UPI002897D036|nr:MICOS complex subunit MIC60, mitochondrial [Cornus florida]
MLRRSLLELSSRHSVRRIRTQITTQIPSYLSSRKEFSVTPQENVPQGSSSTGKSTKSASYVSKIVIGSVALGAAFMTAYKTGYLDELLVKEPRSATDSAKFGTVEKDSPDLLITEDSLDSKLLGDEVAIPQIKESKESISSAEHTEENTKTHSVVPPLEDFSRSEGESQLQESDKSNLVREDDTFPIQEKELPSSPQSSTTSEESFDTGSPELKHRAEQHEAVKMTPVITQANAIPEENETKSMPPQRLTTKDMPENTPANGIEQPSSLLDAYCLGDKAEETSATSSNVHKDLVGGVESSNDVYISKDGKLVLDFLQAIHTAEQRQAELDAHIFAEEKRMLKEKYEKELKDARAKELMYAEEVAMLDKELNKERVKAAAALKSLQEKLEEKLVMELEQKEAEAERNLMTMEEVAKAELAAAIASEKASQIEKMAEANIHISALCMAFYARSEEARQSHSVHKLALGALALEDALSKGLPIQKEINVLHTYLGGIDKDSLLDLVLSSIPEETRNHGTDTPLQLNQKFDALKGTLRQFSLIPPGGSGFFSHQLAQVASWMKVREADQSGNGIESVINRVESFLAKGKLSEAADTLEDGVKGSQAADIVRDWVKQARNRAITQQALTLLQSYATSISVT